MELTINKDRVLKAAKKCEKVKGVLKDLFPEAFDADHDKYFDLCGAYSITDKFSMNCFGRNDFQVRSRGRFEDKGFFLCAEIDWKIEIDEYGEQVLVPRKK